MRSGREKTDATQNTDINMKRRTLLAGTGTGASTLVAGCSRFNGVSTLTDGSNSPNHLVQITNYRDTAQKAFVECGLENEISEYGPESVELDETWQVTRVENQGTFTVRFYVNDELVWEDTHEVPTPNERRSSSAHVELLPDDETRTQVMVED